MKENQPNKGCLFFTVLFLVLMIVSAIVGFCTIIYFTKQWLS